MKIAVIGTGYVGLVTGTCFADAGNDVICVDNDEKKIEMLLNGEIPIYEPGLERLVERNHKAGRLRFTTDIEVAVRESLLCFIAVGTPPGEDGSADLQYVLAVAKDIARYMNDYKIVVDKSTVPVGTGDKVSEEMQKILKERDVNLEFDVVSNPEFLKEGAAIDDFMKPDRIVIGTDNVRVGEIMKVLYSAFSRTHDKILIMSIRAAEMSKYAANAMLATKISFMNEISRLCEAMGADVAQVRVGIGSDTRIGYKFIYPGIGYGGSCFPKDVKALVHMANQYGVESKLLDSVEAVNDEQKHLLASKVKNYFGNNLTGKTFAMWGLSFKPETDDMREAPSLVVIKDLLSAGARIVVFDPVAMDEAKKLLKDSKNIEYATGDYEALENADALLLVTEWTQFRNPNFEKIKERLKQPLIFDGRNQYNYNKLKEMGFKYFAIGRGDKA
ncbi:MAG: UDP-glucose/GDP-mannose dehydrogenase family protein [Candidatus Cloacimonetes bacterium]|nr:UDP-glucose/GDP-mannose dehydrogenase family protein [Candidatus Cloacimonadota bacterium]